MSYFHRGCFSILFAILQIGYCHYVISGNDYPSGSESRPIIHNNQLSLRYPRQISGSSPRDDACKPFEEGDEENHEFYSPGWPGSYPNNTECVRVLEAPKGHLLRLDFREFFMLEKSDNCIFDFLEVRDGAHGYGQLLGQFCGKEFPPMITSTDRYLWLHFHSDENIEYSGFKAVYEFIERPTSSSFTPEVEACRININGSEGMFSSNDIPEERRNLVDTYNIALDCMWIITVKEGWKIQLSFPVFKLDKPNDCDSNFVDIFSDRTDLPSRQKNYCGSIADPVTSKNNLLYVRFLAETRAIHSKFQALFTAFREKKNNEACADDEYDCEDATCISTELRCNGRINCRFRWDEDDCNPKNSGMLNSEHIIIIMVIFSLILSGMCFTFVFNCIKKLIRDHHTIQEHIRQSREQQLNVLGHQNKGLQESVEAKKVLTDHSLSNSSHSSPSQKFDAAVKENSPCYVPGGEMLPILIKGNDHRYNGDPYGILGTTREGTFPSDERTGGGGGGKEYDQCEMCDSACQTRESLFDPPVHQSSQESTATAQASPPAPFSTFGYKKERRYRAEGKIRIEKVDEVADKRGPYSIQSTKSAPDVIVTH